MHTHWSYNKVNHEQKCEQVRKKWTIEKRTLLM